ncbi:MAG TPA: toprim domain-containing protein, partial [Novosphingobium sp.]|nr:toprim domain-containing protein [Novosphingobium sp.]
GRLMVRIEDAGGRVIAFGGRILAAAKTDAPKYLNSPDTPLFDKGRTLYNLHRAGPAARQTGRMIVVEGYMDVIALASAGFADAVAPLGTALTERQIEMLWRLVETPVLCFDGDAAGQRAAMRAVTRALPLLRPAHSLRIVRLPAGMDPDDLLKREGPAAMERLLGEAKSLLDTLWQHERDAMPLRTPEDKAGLKARLLAHVDTIADGDIKALYRRELLERYSAFAFPPRERFAKSGGSFAPRPAAQAVRRRPVASPRGQLVTAVVAGLIRHPSALAAHAEPLAALAAEDPRIDALLDAAEQGEHLESTALASILSGRGLAAPQPEDFARIRFPFVEAGADPAAAADALAVAIAILVEEPALDAAIEDATARLDFEEQQRLLKRKLEFNARLRQMASARSAAPSGSGTGNMAE